MARHCMRPGCDRAAAARLSYDTEAAAVWLDLPLDDGQPAQQVCSIHAASLTAPLGWTVTDRRSMAVGRADAPARSPIVETEVSPFTEARRAARSSNVTEAPTPSDDESADAPGVPVAVSDPTQVGATEASGKEAPDDEALDNKTPDKETPDNEAPDKVAASPKAGTKSKGKLLERAFEWTGPQHSVLTTGHDHRPRRRD